MRLIELIIPSPNAIKKKLHFTIKNFFPKKVVKKSINQLFMSIPAMGLRQSSEPKAHVWNVWKSI